MRFVICVCRRRISQCLLFIYKLFVIRSKVETLYQLTIYKVVYIFMQNVARNLCIFYLFCYS